MKTTFLLALLAGLCASAYAQEPSVDVIDITASIAESGPTGGVSTSSLPEARIEATHQNELEEVLKSISGVEISSNGGAGSQTSIFIRGADAKNVLVLIDGVMVNDPGQANRGANVANISLDAIERVEVLRGAQSVRYGSNAASGVINIITKGGSAKPKAYVGSEVGSYSKVKVYGGASGQAGRLDYAADFSKTRSKGFSTADDRNPDIGHDGNTSEADGWENQNLGLKLGVRLDGGAKLQLTTRKILSDKELDDTGNGYLGDRFDGYPPKANPQGNKQKHQKGDQWFGSVGFHQKLIGGKLDSVVQVKQATTSRELYDQEGEKTNDFVGHSQETTWTGRFKAGEAQRITLGLGRLKEGLVQTSYSSGTQTEDVNRTAWTNSLWVEDLFWSGPWEVVLGLRADQHELFGSVSTYRVAPSYLLLGSRTKLKASYATGFRSPSLYELYGTYTSYGKLYTIGNKELTPETSTSLDLGVEQDLGKLKLTATYFQMDFQDRIEYVYDSKTFVGAYENTSGSTKTQGTELELTGKLAEDWDFGVSLNQTQTKDPNAEPLVRRPKQTLKAQGQWKPTKGLKIHADWRHVGPRKAWSGAFDRQGNRVDQLAAYQVLNLAASWQVSPHLELYSRVDNLTDTYYEEAWAYGTGGRMVTLGGKARF